MFRRSRFSVKPNVRPAAAARGASGSSSSVIREAAAPRSEAQPDSGSTTCASEAGTNSAPLPGSAAGEFQQEHGASNSRDEKTSDANGDGDGSKHSETVLQRRKRIFTTPNLAKPRVAPPSTQRTIGGVESKCSQKPVLPPPAPESIVFQKESNTPEKINIENSPKSPVLPEKKTPVLQVPQFSAFKKSVSKEPNAGVMAQKSDEALQKNTSSPLKERPTQERLIQEEMPPSKSAPAKEKKINSEREKILKAQNLRKLLKEELKKEKQQRKYKCSIIEKSTLEDRSKMLMRDFIYYLPENNPMNADITFVMRQEECPSSTRNSNYQRPEQKAVVDHEDENEEAEEEEGEEEDSPLLVPRVKVAEDGSIILDEESLTVEVLRTKGQCVMEENDPIFERGSTTTYSSFRKSYYTKPWSEKETDMFFLAISMVGTDFSMISQLFPHRARTEIKNKFKREEKTNGWRIDKAFKEKKPFDFDFFAKLLEKVLENERRKKEKDAKCQSSKEKISKEEKTAKSQKKRKAKDVSGQTNHGQDDHQNGRMSDAELEVDSGTAEKENEESLSILEQAEGQTAAESGVAKKKRKRKRKDSEQEADNISEGRTIFAEMSEGERSRRKTKDVSGQTNHGQDDHQNGIISDAELEVDSGTAEKENEESLGLLEQAEQQTESGVAKRKRKDSEQEANNISEERITSAEMSEGERSRRKRMDASSSVKTNGSKDLEIPDGETPDPVDEGPQCFIQLNEEAEGDATLASSSVQHCTFMEAESGELGISEASIGHHVGQPSKCSPSATKVGFEEIIAAKNEVAELDNLNENSSIPAQSHDNEIMDTERAITEKPKVKGQLQRVSEEKEPEVDDMIEIKPALSESLGGIEKGEMEDIVTKAAGSTIEEMTERTNSDMERESQETQKATVEKVGGRRQKPKPNIAKMLGRKEVLAQGKLECRILCEEPDGKVGQSNDLNDAPNVTATETAEKDCQSFDTEAQACEKSLLQESRKPTILKPALLARGRMQKPKPNLGRVARRQGAPRNTEAEGEKLTEAATKTEKTQMQHECSHDEILIKDTIETTTYEVDMPHSEILENKDVFSSKEVGLEHTSHSPVQKPSDCELKKTFLLSISVKDISDLAAGDSSSQKEQQEIAPEIELPLKNYPLNQKEKLGKEEAKCEIPPPSHLLKQHSEDAQDAVEIHKTHQSPENLSDLDSDGANKIPLPSDMQEEISLGKQSSQGKSNRNAIQPSLLLRGRFQRPKPNIGRAIGRKETQSAEKNEATVAIAGTEKSEIQTSTRTSSTIPPLLCANKVLPTEALENRLVDCEKLIQEDSQISGTSRIISDQCSRDTSTSQEDKSCTIKPAQLVRGRFKRARPNLGRMSGKKEEPVSGNVSASVDRGLGKTETEVISEEHLNTPSIDEGSIQTSPDHLVKKDKSESSDASLSETHSEQEKPSLKTLQECELVKQQEEACVSKDIEGKYLTIPGSDISTSQENNKTRNIKPTQLMRGLLQKPKPNLSRAAENKETFSEGKISTEDTIEKEGDGSISGKIPTIVHDFGKLVEAASSPESSKERKHSEITEEVSSKRRKSSGKSESSEQLSESESQIGKDISKPLSAQETAPETLKRKQPERSLKQKKNSCESKTKPTTSECEADHGEKGKRLRKVKPNVSRGKSFKSAPGKKSRKEFGTSKVNLVTLRASSQEEEDDDDADDFEPDYEVESFSPEEVNKAPVFVPKGLRSPNPVPIQIEETMEELEIYENVTEESCITTAEYLYPELHIAVDPVIQEKLSTSLVVSQKEPEKKGGINDGSTEAAMTLLAMRDPEFQLNTTQETQAFSNQDEFNIAESLSKAPNEEQSIVQRNLPLPALSRHELVSSHNTSKAEPKDPSTSGLEECSLKATRVYSDLSLSKENKTSKLTRSRFPKPNLGKSLRLQRNALQKSLSPSLVVAQSNEIQNEEKVSKNVTDEQKVELGQSLHLDKLTKNSSVDEHDLQSGSASQAMQENDTERQDLVSETREGKSELTPKPSPIAESCPSELPTEPNTDINVKLPENISRPAEYKLPTVDVAQLLYECMFFPPQLGTLAVSHSIVECPEAEEEQTFILTLVEISANSEDCSGASTSLQHSEELLPAPVPFTPDNTESVEMLREKSIRATTAGDEENVAFVDNLTETDELQIASRERFADPSSTSQENWKRDAVALEGSDNLPKKKKSSGENLKSSIKVISEQSPSSLNSEPMPYAARSDEQVLRTLHGRKVETSEEQRFVNIWKSKQPEQVGSAVALQKMPLSRPSQKSLGFLPLICKKNNTDESETAKGNKQSLQKPLTLVSKSTALSPRDKKKEIHRNSSLPTTSSSAKSENVSSSTVQFHSDLSKNEGSSKEQEKDEEPTKISEYFFSDIFMEVDDSE
ncbi:hypothetical protein lerEdw1_000366 [Lerista edwardsae]|nr:hypothetical protein lerEdw1_000366 [Lerista edwardsae]